MVARPRHRRQRGARGRSKLAAGRETDVARDIDPGLCRPAVTETFLTNSQGTGAVAPKYIQAELAMGTCSRPPGCPTNPEATHGNSSTDRLDPHSDRRVAGLAAQQRLGLLSFGRSRPRRAGAGRASGN